jgi:hypothetical protein
MPAVTSVTNFSDGNVLTASALNAVNCGIHVYSNAAARDAAYGGSGERTLVEGEYAYLLDTDQTLVYSGSSWVSVGTTPGLVCVKAETSFSAVASVTADNIFTSSYTNYVFLFNFTTSTTNFPSLKLRVGGVSASTNYTSQQIQGFVSTVSTNARTAQSDFSFAYYGNGTREAAIVNIMGPQLAQATQFIVGGGALGGGLVQNIYGLHTTATAYDGIEILVPSGTMTGTYAIYGFSKAV